MRLIETKGGTLYDAEGEQLPLLQPCRSKYVSEDHLSGLVPFGDYPPLLPFGLHRGTAADVRDLCVDRFPRSTTRGIIMDKLEEILHALGTAKLSGEFWIDGSFLTEKIEAKDVDVVFHGSVGPGKVDPSNVDHVRAMHWLNGNLKSSHLCDSYICLLHPGDPNGPARRQYWQRTFGYSRGKFCKGIMVLTLGSGL